MSFLDTEFYAKRGSSSRKNKMTLTPGVIHWPGRSLLKPGPGHRAQDTFISLRTPCLDGMASFTLTPAPAPGRDLNMRNQRKAFQSMEGLGWEQYFLGAGIPGSKVMKGKIKEVWGGVREKGKKQK